MTDMKIDNEKIKHATVVDMANGHLMLNDLR